MKKSPIQPDDLNILTDEKFEKFRKDIGADEIFILAFVEDKVVQRHYGLGPHDLLLIAKNLIGEAMDMQHEEMEEDLVLE